jgi:hypothetical protein
MMTKNPILFVASDLSRGLVLLARNLSKRGHDVAVASPRSENAKYLLNVGHIVLPTFRFSKKRLMFRTSELNAHIGRARPIIHALDDIADKAMRGYEHYDSPVNFGIDLNIYAPAAVSIPRQTLFLTKYNIAPHQKLITVISPLRAKLPALLDALKQLDRNDYIIALLGTTGRAGAKSISNAIAKSNLAGNIILAGIEHDLPSLFRASYATLSLGAHSERLLKLALAMGRPLVSSKNAYDVTPNIPLPDTHADTIAGALTAVLDLSAAKRDTFENQNLEHAKKFCIQKTIKECLDLYKIS